jgi:hypothetical protein
MSSKGKALDESACAELAGDIATASLDMVKRYARGGVVTCPLATNVVTGRL